MKIWMKSSGIHIEAIHPTPIDSLEKSYIR